MVHHMTLAILAFALHSVVVVLSTLMVIRNTFGDRG